MVHNLFGVGRSGCEGFRVCLLKFKVYDFTARDNPKSATDYKSQVLKPLAVPSPNLHAVALNPNPLTPKP